MRPSTEISIQPNLNQRRAVLKAKLEELTGVFQDRSGLKVEVSADVLDTIRMVTDRDVLVERMNISARILCDVRDAIASLDTGDYGICEDCEEPISSKRLDAIPWARVCVKCQDARDRRSAEADPDSFPLAA
jgi:RNA polymerase-binding transcription factor